MARTLHRLLAVALISALLVVGAGIAPALAGPEGTFAKKVNSARSSAGKAPVQVYWDLTDDARRHARNMAKKQKVYPNPNIGSATSGWKALGEVNGAGPSVNVLFDAFLSSYRSTILGPYNYIGVGVAIDESDVMWVSMIFMRGPDGLVDDPPETTTTTTTRPPATTTTAAPAPTTQAPTTTTSAEASPTTSAPEPVAAAAVPNTDRLDLAPTTSLPPAATSTTTMTAAPSTTTTSTTSTTAAPVASEPPSAARPADVQTSEGGMLSDWRLFGVFSVLAAAALVLVGAFGKKTVILATAGSSPAVLFDACANCGLVFNQARSSECPRCHAEQ